MRLLRTVRLMLLLTVSVADAQQFDQLRRGEPVAEPETISGRWVAPDGRGGWLELAVEIMARTPMAGSLLNGPFLLEEVQVGVCQSPGLVTAFGQCNYMMDGPNWGVRLGRSFLQGHVSAGADSEGIDVDLVREGDAWTGTLRRKGWSGKVRFERGGEKGLTGTWVSTDLRECLHIAERPEGLLASLDQLSNPRTMRFAASVPPSPPMESFGRFLSAERAPGGVASFDFVSAGPGRTLRVRALVRGGAVALTGLRSGDGRSGEPDWVRVPGASCRARIGRAEAPRRKKEARCQADRAGR